MSWRADECGDFAKKSDDSLEDDVCEVCGGGGDGLL